MKKINSFFTSSLRIYAIASMMIATTVASVEGEPLNTNHCFSENKFLNYLDSNKHTFRLKGKKVLFPREDASRERGEQDYELSELVLSSLDLTKDKRIQFNMRKLYFFDRKGTCSAMALDFLARFMEAEKKCVDEDELKKHVKLFKPYYRANTTVFSSRQAAFNTIEIKPEFRLLDPKEQDKNKLAKIKSLALYHNIKLSAVTSSLMTKKVCADNLSTIINNLKDGYYVIRMLSPNLTNEKMENYGHTLILIKKKKWALFFDNAIGADEIEGDVGKEITQHISAKLGYIPEIRFYQVSKSRVKNISTEKTFN